MSENNDRLSSYQAFLGQPLRTYLALTKKKRELLADVGAKTFGDFISVDIDLCPWDASVKNSLLKSQEDLRQLAERQQAIQVESQAMQGLEADEGTPMRPRESSDIDPILACLKNKEAVEGPKGGTVLGEQWDPTRRRAVERVPVSVDWDSLTRHVFIAGGTGSGKTVLGKVLIEEAASAGIPSIVIDPAGDLAQLWLRPTYDFDETTVRAFASHYPCGEEAQSHEQWATILGDHRRRQEDRGVTEAVVGRVYESSFVRLLAPVSQKYGMQIALPPFDASQLVRLPDEDQSEYHTRLSSVTGSLISALKLKGSKADRINTVVLNLLQEYSEEFIDVDPLSKLRGMFDRLERHLPHLEGLHIDEYITEKELLDFKRSVVTYQRGIGTPWLTGSDFNMDILLECQSGLAPINVISIHQLTPAEQQNAVAQIIQKVDHWMKTSGGSTSGLRALVYLDEVGGGGGKDAFFPPTAQPVCKPPLLRLLRQGRKYGVGVIMATQNVKDIDYKGLANINSWYVGKLSQANDRDYISKGISGADIGRAGLSSGDLSRHLPALGQGLFLNVDSLGKPSFFRARFLSSLHCSPDKVLGIYDRWLEEHEFEAEAEASLFLETAGAEGPSVRMNMSTIFCGVLVKRLADESGEVRNLTNVIDYLFNHSGIDDLEIRVENVVRKALTDLPLDEAKKFASDAMKAKSISSDFRSDLASRSLALKIEDGDDPGSFGDIGANQPRKGWWRTFLAAMNKWSLSGGEFIGCKVYTGNTSLSVRDRDIASSSNAPIRQSVKTVNTVSESIRELKESIPKSDLIGWYQSARGEEEAGQEVDLTDVYSLMQAEPLLVAEDFDFARAIQSELKAMDPFEFEHYTADILRQRGVEVEVTKASGDDGVDLFAVDSDGGLCAIQCKRYLSDVGPGAIRELAGSRQLKGCSSALMVTTSSLTSAARKTADDLDIKFIEGAHLAALHLELLGN